MIHYSFLKLQKVKTISVKKILYETLKQACDYHKVIIFCNPINEYSLAYFLEGAIGKGKEVNIKTNKTGFFKGLIDVTGYKNLHPSKPLEYKFNGKVYKSSMVAGKEDFIDANLAKEEYLLYFLTDRKGNFIVSDLDILLIGNNNDDINLNKLVNSKTKGFVTNYEIKIIDYINKLFYDNLKEIGCLDSECNSPRLIQHGPFNRFPGSKQSHIHFPILIFSPKSEPEIFGSEQDRELSLRELLKYWEELPKQGYNIDLNNNWGFYDI